MRDYLYDGTFEGLLTCIYHHYYTDKAAGIYPSGEYQPSLLHGSMEVETDEEKAARVYNAIGNKISGYSLRLIYRVYLSGITGKENVILSYVLLGFRVGPSIGSLHARPEVQALEDIVRKVGNERERMLQFVRFEVMEAAGGGPQILYAKIEPEHDVLELIANHFSERFSHDPLIIHDIGRSKAIVAYERDWYVTDFDGTHLPDGTAMLMSEDERSYQDLWRTYFDHIAIKERTNPRCQKNHMPVRYWKHLTEVNGAPVSV
ncbi:MAG: TIGR03915 family putative DNA repair protein [Clostridia bacterium]|nr:TIGR03915 family putative DNA repair protein [Clostridia bacterium]